MCVREVAIIKQEMNMQKLARKEATERAREASKRARNASKHEHSSKGDSRADIEEFIVVELLNCRQLLFISCPLFAGHASSFISSQSKVYTCTRESNDRSGKASNWLKSISRYFFSCPSSQKCSHMPS